ncbi:MAG: cobalt ECF transporter T component CbiQ [Bacillota bacterium]|nr:cobalt ECF transporter T component CbiQ [Bacillota bacterium]
MFVEAERRPGLPDWLTEEVPPPPNRRGGRRFVSRTVQAVAGVIREDFLSARRAAAPGLLQSLDPRVKVVTLGGLIVVASLSSHWAVILGLYLAALAAGLASRLGLSLLVTRVWPFCLLFAGVAALPMVLSWVTPGEALAAIWTGGPRLGPLALPPDLYLSREGLLQAAVFTSRVALCMTLALLLALTTPASRLFLALRALRVPRVFVVLLETSQRYLFLLLRMVQELHIAREARTISPAGPPAGRRFAVQGIAVLLSRSLLLSEEVHQAMLARGYTGEPRVVDGEGFRAGWRDLAWTVGCIAAAAAALAAQGYLI